MTPKTIAAYGFGPFRLDPTEHLLLRDGRPVALTPKVFDVLQLLVEQHGHLVHKAMFFEQVWADSFVEEANLNRSIAVLRKALGESAGETKYIETVPKRGYRFVAPVTMIVVPAGASPADNTAPPPEGAEPRLDGWGWHSRAATATLVIVAAGSLITWSVGRGAIGATTPFAVPRYEQVTFGGREGGPAISPDGQRIAYVSSGRSDRSLVVQELAAGAPLTVFQAPEVMNLRWSPDGSELLFAARGGGTDGVFAVSRSGGSARRLAARPLVATWSPDGATIVLARYQSGTLEFITRHGEPLRTISLHGVKRWIADLDWSPQGDWLLVAGNDDAGRSTIWTVRPDGADQRALAVADAEIPAARWGPAGDTVYYLRRDGQTFSLYRTSEPWQQDAAPSGDRLVLSGLDSDGAFGLAADGQTLVYARASFRSELWAVDVEHPGSDAVVTTTQLTRDSALVERPRLSPDGSAVVFNAGREPAANLYTIPSGGGTPRQLTFMDGFSVGGAWSADGQTVAFASTSGGRRRVWVVPAAGGPPHPVSSGDPSDSFDVTWSPGTRILYQQAGNRNFGVLNPETGDEQPLVRNPRGWVFSPVVAPDRRRIAVSWSGRPDPGVWLVTPGESTETLVHGSTGPPLLLGWSADGETIYGYEGRRAAYRGLSVNLGETMTDVRIVAVPVDGGPLRPIVSLPFDEVGGLTMTRDGRRFVCAVYSSRSDVWLVENPDRASDFRAAVASVTR